LEERKRGSTEGNSTERKKGIRNQGRKPPADKTGKFRFCDRRGRVTDHAKWLKETEASNKRRGQCRGSRKDGAKKITSWGDQIIGVGYGKKKEGKEGEILLSHQPKKSGKKKAEREGERNCSAYGRLGPEKGIFLAGLGRGQEKPKTNALHRAKGEKEKATQKGDRNPQTRNSEFARSGKISENRGLGRRLSWKKPTVSKKKSPKGGRKKTREHSKKDDHT